MSSVAPVDAALARLRVEGQDGPSSPEARAAREQARQASVSYGAAAQVNAPRPSERAQPSAVSDRTRQKETQRAREDRNADRLADQRSDQTRRDDSKGRLVDISI